MYIYIRSMSERQSEIHREISAASKQIDMHIIRLMLYPNSSYRDHWMHEIWSFLFEVDKLKGKNKYPKAKFIKDALAAHNDVIDNYKEIVEDLEGELTERDISTEYIIQVIEKYQDWLANELSTHGKVKQSDVKIELTFLTAY